MSMKTSDLHPAETGSIMDLNIQLNSKGSTATKQMPVSFYYINVMESQLISEDEKRVGAPSGVNSFGLVSPRGDSDSRVSAEVTH